MMNRVQASVEQIRNEIDQLAKSAILTALDGLFNSVVKKLFIRAEHALSPEDKSEQVKKIDLINRKRKDFEKNLFTTLRSSDIPTKEIKWYSVIKNRALSILIEDVILQAKAKFGVELAQYESRIRSLHAKEGKKLPDGLYTLNAISYAFINSTYLYDKEIQESLVQALGSNLLYKLEPLYALLNDSLIQYGVLPEFRTKRNTDKSGIDSLIDLFSQDESLIEQEIERQHEVPQQELIRLILTTVRNGRVFIADDEKWSPDQLLSAIILEYESVFGKQDEKNVLSRDDRKTIELTAVMLSEVINSKGIHRSIQKIVLELQSIILYVALTEKDFITDSNHYARRVFAKLEGMGRDEHLGRDDFGKINLLLRRFIRSFSSNSNSPLAFQDLYKELEILDGDEEHIVKSKDNEFSDLQQTKTRIENKVDFIISNAIGASKLEEASRDLIDYFLKPFMVVSLISYGRQSEEWKSSLALLDLIINTNNISDIGMAHIQEVEILLDRILGFGSSNPSNQQNFDEKKIIDHYLAYIQSRDASPKDINPSIISEQAPDAASNPIVIDEPNFHASQEPTFDAHDASIQFAEKSVNEDEFEIKTNDDALIDEAVKESKEEALETDFSLCESFVSDSRVISFLNSYVLCDEWFHIFISSESAPRRLKANKMDHGSNFICFTNRNGEKTLVLPLSQFIEDLFNNRSFPVFDNSDYISARDALINELGFEVLKND